MTHGENDRPLAACSLEPGQQASRRDRWLRLADRSLVTKLATETGARLVYRSGGGVEAELAISRRPRLECCGFADWRVGEASEGLIDLEVSTDRETVPVVHAWFDLP
ncbi:MAG: hypothetical protein H0T96_02225 [Thermoleophilaceae bacterium]|jgi:hypothetical protein|nr:hypothetical protein [Thermoleophilaceae bacterium]MDQ3320623.1 hypothetical protein [Actinomycetota bacterium]MDQ3356686.1 hypothetical protein [Actinomycetota bacterium]